jgi:hypothetical protein
MSPEPLRANIACGHGACGDLEFEFADGLFMSPPTQAHTAVPAGAAARRQCEH